MECFFRRLADSPYNKLFVLKGAMSFGAFMEGSRNTKDSDFQMYGHHDSASIRKLFTDICLVSQDDGIQFLVDEITVQNAGENREYSGFILLVPALLGTMRMKLQFDIGFGEVITPEPVYKAYPVLLRLDQPKIRVYPLESVISEKFEAMVNLGMKNGRMKDFYDLADFAEKLNFNGSVLRMAISNTFAHRATDLPKELPLAWTPQYFASKQRIADFKAFLQRHSLPKTRTLEGCCATIIPFLMPLCVAVTSGDVFDLTWQNGSWN